jgi:hypothetical protein
MAVTNEYRLHFICDVLYPNGESHAVAEISIEQGFDPLFEAVKIGYLEWRNKHGNGNHRLSICCEVPNKSDAYREFIAHFCERWNVDADLQSWPPVRVDLSLNFDEDGWIGCTTGTSLVDSTANQPQMQFYDVDEQLRELDAIADAAKEEARARRRANPVRNPVKLPRGIASEIAGYLRREYGESWWQRGAIRARNLTFVGEYVIDGVPTQYWAYPSSEPMWATVERFDDSYCLGMTDDAPPAA